MDEQVSLSFSLPIRPPHSLSISLSVVSLLSLSLFLYGIYLFIYLFMLYIFLFIYLSYITFYLFIYLTYLFIYLYLSIYQTLNISYFFLSFFYPSSSPHKRSFKQRKLRWGWILMKRILKIKNSCFRWYNSLIIKRKRFHIIYLYSQEMLCQWEIINQ